MGVRGQARARVRARDLDAETTAQESARRTLRVADVQQGGLPPGTERSLLAKLGVAQRKLDAGNRQAA